MSTYSRLVMEIFYWLQIFYSLKRVIYMNWFGLPLGDSWGEGILHTQNVKPLWPFESEDHK